MCHEKIGGQFFNCALTRCNAVLGAWRGFVVDDYC